MYFRFKFCTLQRVCVLNFLIKSQIPCTLLYSMICKTHFFLIVLKVSSLSAFSYEDHNGCSLPWTEIYIQNL
jgi:hypothetical protein